MNLTQIIIVAIYLVWVSIPLLLATFNGLLGFWSRGRIKAKLPFKELQRRKFGWTTNFEFDTSYAILMFTLFEVMALSMITGIIGMLVRDLPATYLLAVPVLLGLIILPKYVCDLFHNLKWNRKTHESDAINELRNEIEMLKRVG